MIRAVIFDADVKTAERLRQALAETGRADPAALYCSYPNFSELDLILQIHQPDVIFCGSSSLNECAGLAPNARLLAPGVPVVAAGAAPEPEDLMCLFDSGVREFLGVPFDPALVRSCLDRVTLQLSHGDTGRHSRYVHEALAGA